MDSTFERFPEIISTSDNYTNQVLVHDPPNGKKIVYYLPVYLRFTVRRIHHIQLQSSVAQASGTLIFSIGYQGLPGNQQMQLQKWSDVQGDDWKNQKPWYLVDLMRKVELKINGQDGFIFDSQKDIFVENSLSISHDQSKHLLSYTIRDTFECDVDGNIALTPFQTLNLYSEFSLRTVECGYTKDGKKVQLKFNMMDTYEDSTKLEIRMRTTTGEYGVGEKKCIMVYTHSQETFDKNNPQVHKMPPKDGGDHFPLSGKNKTVSPSKNDNKITYWQHANIKIVLFKHPMTTIFSIMMPMWVLAVIVQLSFFQQSQLAGRIGTVAMALVAYMAFIPSVRQKIPPSPNFTFIEIVIVLLLVTSMLTAIRGFLSAGVPVQDYVWHQDPLFIITLVINAATLIVTLIITVVFYVHFRKQYTDDNKQNKKVHSFKKQNWRNPRADEEFRYKTQPVLHHKNKRHSTVKLEPLEIKTKQDRD